MSDLIRVRDSQSKEAFCKLCENKKASIQYKYSYNEEVFDIVECEGCRHIYIDPVPLGSVESRTMDTLSDAEFDGNSVLKFLHEHLVIKKEINNVKRVLNKNEPALLDIGCGTGWTTSIWQKHGFRVTGLEPSQQRCEFAKENYMVNIVNGHLEELDSEKKFDIIVLRHVLEHIEEPGEFISEVSGHLNENGLILITIPNINSIGRYLFKENWEWVLPWHLHFYFPKTLKALVQKCGFECVRVYQMPSPLWYPSSLARYLGKESRFSRFLASYAKLSTLVIVSPIVLLGMVLGLNDNMTLIAKKL